MATYNFSGNNPLPQVNIEVKKELSFDGNASFQRNATMANETLTVIYTGDNGVVMRSIDGDFEHWDEREKVELIELLSKFCIRSLKERYE